MNQTQKKYAMLRVEDILEHKARKIRKAMPKSPVKKQLTYRQAAKLIKDGKVKLHVDMPPNKTMYDCKYITDMFDFSDYCTREPRGPGYDEDACMKKIKPFHVECQRIRDQIMLGDSEEALKLIDEFAKI